jgi:hypothetical protein
VKAKLPERRSTVVYPKLSYQISQRKERQLHLLMYCHKVLIIQEATVRYQNPQSTKFPHLYHQKQQLVSHETLFQFYYLHESFFVVERNILSASEPSQPTIKKNRSFCWDFFEELKEHKQSTDIIMVVKCKKDNCAKNMSNKILNFILLFVSFKNYLQALDCTGFDVMERVGQVH